MTNQEAIWAVMEMMGLTSDDAIDERLISNYIDQARARIMPEYIFQMGGDIPSSATVKYGCRVISQEEDCDGCYSYFIDLPVSPMDLPGSNGVLSVHRPRSKRSPGKPIPRTNNSSVGIESQFRFYTGGWRLLGDRIYIYEQIPVGATLDVYLVPSKISDLPENTRFPAPDGILSDIFSLAKVIALGEEDKINDGVNNSENG